MHKSNYLPSKNVNLLNERKKKKAFLGPEESKSVN